MASKRYKNIDSSDMQIWASCAPASAFMEDIADRREVALRSLIRKPTEDLAAVVRAYDKVLSLLNEHRNVNS